MRVPTLCPRRGQGDGQGGHGGGGAPGGRHVRAAVGEGEAQHARGQRLLRVVARDPEVVGAAHGDPAHAARPRLGDGELHGEVAHHGAQAVVAVHQGSRASFFDDCWLGVGVTYLNILLFIHDGVCRGKYYFLRSRHVDHNVVRPSVCQNDLSLNCLIHFYKRCCC